MNEVFIGMMISEMNHTSSSEVSLKGIVPVSPIFIGFIYLEFRLGKRDYDLARSYNTHSETLILYFDTEERI